MKEDIKKILFAVLLVIYCNITSLTAQNLKPILIRPFGDSITYGVGFSDWGNCYISQINQQLCMPPAMAGGGYRGWLTLLATQGLGLYFTTEGYQSGGSYYLQWLTNTQTHDGYPGYRTDQLIQFSTFASFSNFTLIHAGTNDILQNKSYETAANNLFSIINNVLATNTNTTVVVAKIIQISSINQVYSILNSQIQLYNALIDSKFNALPPNLKARVRVVNMYNLLNDQNDYSPDGIHPNASGYFKMACNWMAGINNSNPSGPCSGLNFEKLKLDMNSKGFDDNDYKSPNVKIEKLIKGEL
ncbi:hydrolase [Leptospira biflexa]|uniref:GDSL-type esterase/lipase family protein n=1 Tax=Leptospira TaxID=171 RepID=UPI0010912798|nr:GDSL-type esterase/lipase family protein [Leptospira biflexa]TGM42888.1 hydrolase [Leptospira biflexa]TGM51234.1 hydrolase [Leptospira biflexa]